MQQGSSIRFFCLFVLLGKGIIKEVREEGRLASGDRSSKREEERGRGVQEGEGRGDRWWAWPF